MSAQKTQARRLCYILVFDLGTTCFKGTLFDDKGDLKALARIPTPFTNTAGGYSEISVPAFDASLLALTKDLQKDAPEAYAQVNAVTFATQTNSFVLLDEKDEALTPIVVWNDLRAMDHDTPLDTSIADGQECGLSSPKEGARDASKTTCDFSKPVDEPAGTTRTVHRVRKPALLNLEALPGFYEKTGIPGLSPEFAVAKLHWYQIQCPELWERVARIALISDLLTLRFAEQFVTEAGAAGLTGLVNIHTLQWWPEALEIAGLERDDLPNIVRAGANLGPITPDAATRFGLPADCVFVVGCLDQYAGAIGAGNIHAGDVSETTGTVLATVRSTDRFDATPGSPIFWGPSARPGRYYQMVFGSVSANLLEAFQKALPTPVTFAELDELAAATETSLTLPDDVDGPKLLSHVREWARTQDTGEAVRAILTGVADALKRQVEQLCGTDKPTDIHCVGGAAKSRVWMNIKANAVGVPMRTVDCPEPTSLGAALLVMANLTGKPMSELVMQHVKLEPPILPKD